MNQSIRNFAVAALIGVASANSCTQVSLPDPDQYVDLEWNELAEDYFDYLSQCSNTDKVQFAEGSEFLQEIKSQLEASNEITDLD